MSTPLGDIGDSLRNINVPPNPHLQNFRPATGIMGNVSDNRILYIQTLNRYKHLWSRGALVSFLRYRVTLLRLSYNCSGCQQQ